MTLKRTVFLGVAAAAVAATAVFAASHGGPPPQVKARKAHMQLYAFNLGTLGAMAKGEMEFDAEKAQRAADNLATLVTVNQMDYWVPGTTSAEVMESRLKPAMFDNFPDVMVKVGALSDAVMAMQAAAGTLDGVRASIGAVGGACGGCHKPYREPAE